MTDQRPRVQQDIVERSGWNPRSPQARLASARAARDQVVFSRTQAEQVAAQIAQMEAAVRQAELDLSYAKVYAGEVRLCEPRRREG